MIGRYRWEMKFDKKLFKFGQCSTKRKNSKIFLVHLIVMCIADATHYHVEFRNLCNAVRASALLPSNDLAEGVKRLCLLMCTCDGTSVKMR